MIQSYRDNKSLTSEEATANAIAIAQKRHHSKKEAKWNRGGWPQNKGHKVKIQSIGMLYMYLAEYGPLYAYYSDDSNSAHMIVVTGVDLLHNCVFTNNPWGYYGSQSFDAFTEGFVTSGEDEEMPFVCVYIAK